MSSADPSPTPATRGPVPAFTPAYFADLLMRQGLATALVAWAAYQLIPAHVHYLDKQTGQMAAQTEILKGQAVSSARIENLLAELTNGEMAKPERWNRLETKIDHHGEEIKAVGQTVNEIRAAVKQQPGKATP
jgi:hypothetical protein